MIFGLSHDFTGDVHVVRYFSIYGLIMFHTDIHVQSCLMVI